jgi:hypothetical protein
MNLVVDSGISYYFSAYPLALPTTSSITHMHYLHDDDDDDYL